jgi:topoisomerase-4 subunit A
MSKHTPPPQGPKDIESINLRDALEERYLAYALSTIMHRALPDVRDGMMPVHRRLLYAMRLLKLDPASLAPQFSFERKARLTASSCNTLLAAS